jgi:hypothetical protein
MGFVEGETGYCSETCVTYDDGTEEVSIKVEDPINIKEEVSIEFEAVCIKAEIQEVTSVPPIKTEHEVRFWGVYAVVSAHAYRPFIALKGNSDITLSCFLVLCCVAGAILCCFVCALLCYVVCHIMLCAMCYVLCAMLCYNVCALLL